ncbi:hypothetical protein FB451DRAFT_1385877 [Mycena latifolia]|nr:hypothetical protein FB451DRAFT_1385877 [Mycena latifolia]
MQLSRALPAPRCLSRIGQCPAPSLPSTGSALALLLLIPACLTDKQAMKKSAGRDTITTWLFECGCHSAAPHVWLPAPADLTRDVLPRRSSRCILRHAPRQVLPRRVLDDDHSVRADSPRVDLFHEPVFSGAPATSAFAALRHLPHASLSCAATSQGTACPSWRIHRSLSYTLIDSTVKSAVT